MSTRLHEILDGIPDERLFQGENSSELEHLRAVIRLTIASIKASSPPNLADTVMHRIRSTPIRRSRKDSLPQASSAHSLTAAG